MSLGDMLWLGGFMTALFLLTNYHIDDRADRIEKRLSDIEGKEKEP